MGIRLEAQNRSYFDHIFVIEVIINVKKTYQFKHKVKYDQVIR
jgi:hypothetical protein